MDEVLNALNSTEFENWLWKREKSPYPGLRVDLRNRAIFPAFSGLSDKGGVDMDLYRGPGGLSALVFSSADWISIFLPVYTWR